MRQLTLAHLDLWTAKNAPKWAAQIKQPTHRPTASIHRVVNANAGQKPIDSRHHASNLCNILQSMRTRIADAEGYGTTVGPHKGRYISKDYRIESLRAELYRMAISPYSTDPKRRTAFARKWYNRLAGIP